MTYEQRALDLVANSLRPPTPTCPKCGSPGDPRLLGHCHDCAASKWGGEGSDPTTGASEPADQSISPPPCVREGDA